MPHRTESVQSSSTTKDVEIEVGKVFLVGAGPGDPGLLTLRGHECLQRADIVLFDGLASEELLEYAPQAECISVGKHGQIPIWSQTNINDKIVSLARQGKQVVRLKGGDPAVFARTAEELDVLIAEKIPFEVIPGITAALAAASYVGIPITHRHHASAVALITGQQQTGEEPQQLDWDALARFPGTIVFYMGVTTVGEWTAKLIAAGKSASTPAAIVRRCTWSDQAVVRCSLGEVAEHLTPSTKMRPPVIVIIGAVAALGEDFDWFSTRPLHGCGVLVTRTAGQNDGLVQAMRQLGAEVFQQPVFTVSDPLDCSSLEEALGGLLQQRFAGITFSSANGVSGLLNFVFDRGHDARLFAGLRLAAVGRATAKQLTHFGLRCDILPTADVEQDAAGLLSALAATVQGQAWLVTTTNRSGGYLQRGLAAAGALVHECLCYETAAVPKLKPAVITALHAGRIDFVTISSSFVAQATHALLNQSLAGDLSRIQPIALSRGIAEKLEQLKWPAPHIAHEHSDSALVAAITTAWESLRRP